MEQSLADLRGAKSGQTEALQLKDVYRKKCEAYLRQRKDIEEQINDGGELLILLLGYFIMEKCPLNLF